jgi:hypothetical protein
MKHRQKPKPDAPPAPYFIADWHKLPNMREGWTETPDRQNRFIVQIRCVRFTDGTTRKFYLTIPKPVSEAERNEMRKRALAILKEINADDTSALVARERRLFKVKRNRVGR